MALIDSPGGVISYKPSGFFWRSPRTIGRGVARIFQGGLTLCQNEGTLQIIMFYSPTAVGCWLKKGLQKGGGSHRTPLAIPLNSKYLFILIMHTIFYYIK